MSGPFGSSQWMYSSGAAAFYDFPIEQSLKFNDDDSSYLSWTPASAGNRKTWTWSGWVKRTALGVTSRLFSAAPASPDKWVSINLTSTDKISVQSDGSTAESVITQAVYRDTSAWYHIVVAFNVTDATAANRVKIYVNGVQQSVSAGAGYFLNQNYAVNDTVFHGIGALYDGASYYYGDFYLSEVNFIDGQALDPTSFGEFKSGVWIPKDPSNLTYGTNGFRLSFQNDTVSEGFNAVTYRGNGVDGHSINGLGQSPDLVWIKSRSTAYDHYLTDTVRGSTKHLSSNQTSSEFTRTDLIKSFDSDGFTLGNLVNVNNNGSTYVAWCWDAGSGSPVSNTDGSITSTVKANSAYGMSIISYTGTGSNATVGHSLNSAPELLIVKNRTSASTYWCVYNKSVWENSGTDYTLLLPDTGAAASRSTLFNSTQPTSSVFSIGTNGGVNTSGNNYIAYAFHSVANYSSVGSYSGNGSTSGPVVNLGFKPAFVMIKGSSLVSQWNILDNTRDTDGVADKRLFANLSSAEGTGINAFNFTSTGFEITTSDAGFNGSGETYIYIAFADTRDNAFWRDQSGNGNDWQPNNLTYQDSLPDSTTNNFCTLNPLNTQTGSLLPQLANGNLELNLPSGFNGTPGSRGTSTGTFTLSSGKYYFEVACTGGGGGTTAAGLTNDLTFNFNGTNYIESSFTNIRKTGSGTDILQFAFDCDTDTVWVGKNGTWDSGDPATGTGGSSLTAPMMPFITGYNDTTNRNDGIMNFGQDSSFAGNKPAQGNTDDNGIGDFYYAPPSGYLALCTANLPDPVIDPAQDDVPSDYFNTVTWTGNGASSRSITGVGFQPSFLWTKNRSTPFVGATSSHYLSDSVRGSGAAALKILISNSTGAEVDGNSLGVYGGISSLDADGFTITTGTDGNENRNSSGVTYVGWNWLAGNGTSSNTDGSISSTISVNQKAGFSIATFTDTGSACTVGHGLGVAPDVVIAKFRGASGNWSIYHKSLGPTKRLVFTTSAELTSSGWWNNTAPTSTVFSLGSSLVASTTQVAYCFAEVEGYSKFGSFVGNDSEANAPFVYLGFRPSLLILKNASAAQPWVMIDSTRSTYNVSANKLYPNASDAENSTSTDNSIDFLSNGFKPRGNAATNDATNGPSNTIIYMAFAENPFKYANAR